MTSPIASDTAWLQPDWPAPAGVGALCTTRNGGHSAPPYNSLNLGSHVGDKAADVLRNRTQLQERLAPARPVYLNQVHGTELVELVQDSPDGLAADGVYTRERGVACSIMVADCLPVLLCDTRGRMVGAVHAGWRGLAGAGGVGVLEEIHQRFMQEAPVQPNDSAIEVIAWLGPCIGPRAFEVGPDVVQAFVQDCPDAEQHFLPQTKGKYLANLQGLARQKLAALGVIQVFGNDGADMWCTASNRSQFFSHRRDRISGRQLACIWLR